MKLTTKRDELVAKLSIVSRAVSTRAATQSLSGILLTAGEEGVSLCATDLELGLKTKLAAEVDSPGSILLPGRLLAELSRSLGDPSVEIELREAERDVEIRSGGSSFHLRTLPSEDFPAFPEEEGEPLTIPAPALASTVDLVARAASRDDMRPVLTGVLVSASGSEMTMVATDSYRLAVKRTELESAIGGELEAEHPGQGAARAGPDRLGRWGRGGLGRPAAQPGHFQGRGDRPQHEADRGAVPQLSTTPAGVLRARRALAPQPSSSTSSAGSASWRSATRRCGFPSRRVS